MTALLGRGVELGTPCPYFHASGGAPQCAAAFCVPPGALWRPGPPFITSPTRSLSVT
jgi:hypothetical protein